MWHSWHNGREPAPPPLEPVLAVTVDSGLTNGAEACKAERKSQLKILNVYNPLITRNHIIP